jgi:hypothetical protein
MHYSLLLIKIVVELVVRIMLNVFRTGTCGAGKTFSGEGRTNKGVIQNHNLTRLPSRLLVIQRDYLT